MGKNNRQRRAQKKLNKTRRSKELKKKKIKEANKPLGPAFQMIPNPFADLDDDARKQAIQEIAQNSEKIYQESLTKIKDVLHKHDPVTLLSVIASYGLTVGVGDNGIQAKDSDFTIYQAHVELCQGFALQIKPEGMQRLPFGPDVVKELWDSLDNLMNAYNYRGLAQDIDNEREDAKAVRLLQHGIRSNTQMVRNWGYFSQVKSISQEIYGYFDEALEGTYGFTATNIIQLFQLLIDEIENANSSRYIALSNLYKLKDKTQLIFKYHEMIGQSSEKADQFINNIDIDSIPYKSLFSMLMSHYDLRLPDNYKFLPSYLSVKLGLEESIVKTILDEFSYEWGGLESYETEYLYLSNPVWLRPIIKLETDEYFCVFPQVFFSFVIPSLDRLIENLDKKALSNRRAAYLEEKVVEIINRRFPEHNTVSGVKWKHDSTEYETDLITFIDSHAVVVEAKSGKISDPALRGAPARLRKHIEEILIAPNIQSKRLKQRLEELITNPGINDALRDKLPVDLNSIHKIIRVSVSLEDFGSIQANVAQLRETGWLPKNFEPCPTMNIADFETLFDFLDHPVQIIHYLERRQELEKVLGYMGDELDLMGLYMGTLFNVGDIDPEANFVISEMSSPLDAFYNSRDAGVDIPKPKPKISPLFSGILEQLEKRHTTRWTEIGVILNRFSPEDQRQLTKMVEKIKKIVRKNWMIEGHKNIAIVTPPRASEYALCYVVYNDYNANKRNDFIQKAAMLGLEPEHIKQCLVIAKNMDRNDVNYDFIGLME
jgi:hypothetical protein